MVKRPVKTLAVSLGLLIGCSTAMSGGEKEGVVAQGKAIYAENNCGACHTIDSENGKFGGDLGEVGAKRDAEWLTRFLRQPKVVMPEAKMRPFDGSEEELKALVAYLASLK